jgi:Ca-activated chloride channel family protein
MKKAFLLFLMGLLISVTGFGDDNGAAGSINSRIRRIAEQGNIVHPEEIIPNLYAGSIDYKYPEPEQDVDVYLYNNMDMQGEWEGVLQIGLQSKSQSFDDIPPLNMVLLVDTSASMATQIPHLKDSIALFMEKVRPVDSLSLVGFNDTASVLFPASVMDSPEKRQAFVHAVGSIHSQGDTNIEDGLKSAYDQALVNLKQDAVNAVILVSDGTDLSARRKEEGARSGDIRVSLSWKNHNDLDLHVITPSGERIYYNQKKDSTGGELDVDMNINGETTEPIENIFWQESVAPPVGTYRVLVQNFKFHGDGQTPTPFMVELKNGRSIQSFESQVNGMGNSSAVEVCSFQYSGDEQAQTFQIIESYQEQSISISTLGIGDDFDAELMRTLAEEAQGSARFLTNSEVLMDIFGSDVEFERLAVPLARNLTVELAFLSGVEILEADGATIVEDRLFYDVPILNAGDYRTFLTRYRLPSFDTDTPQTVELASLTMKAGEETIQQKTFAISLAQASHADPTAAYSSALLRFAENLKQIGEIYYQDKDQAAALQKTRESAAEIDAADQHELFADESFILARYVDILTRKTETTAPPPPRKSIMSTDVGKTSWRFK